MTVTRRDNWTSWERVCYTSRGAGEETNIPIFISQIQWTQKLTKSLESKTLDPTPMRAYLEVQLAQQGSLNRMKL